jgi:hypothetical protein
VLHRRMRSPPRKAIYSFTRSIRASTAQTRYAAGVSTVVNPRVGGSHGDLAQALALACYELARFGRSSPEEGRIDWDALPFAGSVRNGTPTQKQSPSVGVTGALRGDGGIHAGRCHQGTRRAADAFVGNHADRRRVQWVD